MRITYDKVYKEKVVKALGLKRDSDDILHHAKTDSPVIDIEGENISYKNFGGIRKGSINYVKSDITSLVKLSQKIRGK